MESKQRYYGQYENGKSLYRGEEMNRLAMTLSLQTVTCFNHCD